MSEQQRDVFYYGGEEYSIIAKRGEGLFTLPKNNRAFAFFCASNPDGYYCEYEVSDDLLILRQINMLYPDDKLQINGIKGKYIESIDEAELTIKEKFERYMGVKQLPEMEMRERYGGEYIFQNIDLPMKQFCGELLIGTNFERDYYIPNIGFQKAWSYSHVYELHFDKGKISKCIELSEYAQKLRGLYCDILAEKETTDVSYMLAEWNQITSKISDDEFAHSWEYVDKRRLWRL